MRVAPVRAHHPDRVSGRRVADARVDDPLPVGLTLGAGRYAVIRRKPARPSPVSPHPWVVAPGTLGPTHRQAGRARKDRGAPTADTSTADYDDGLIACSGTGLVIRRYGAFLRPKRIPYADIRKVTKVELGGMSFGRWRLWGSNDLRHWFNLDWHRPKKRVGLVLDLGRRALPVITPDDPEWVVAVLRRQGIEVSPRTDLP